MGQFQKDEIREALLSAAKIEFLELGFNRASMRIIARRAEQNPANIYNYFKNKNDLFYHLVAPTLSAIDQGLKFASQWQPSQEQPMYSLDDEREAIHHIINYMDANRDEVFLLAFRAQGSKYENCFNQATRELAQVFRNAISAVIAFNPGQYTNEPSEFFILNLIRFLYNGLLSMLKYGMSKDEMTEKSEELMIFYYTGVLELMKKKN